MERERRGASPLIGGSSLLVIFAVLCLTVFALLGLSLVQAGGRLSQASVRSVAAYYEADCLAEELFARLRNGEIPEGVEPCGCWEEGYTYLCPVSETQQLRVEVHPGVEGWTIHKWQLESTAGWEEDTSMPDLWDGTLF